MRNWLKTLLFMSAFSPIMFPMAWIKWQQGDDLYGMLLLLAGLVGLFLAILVVILIHRHGEAMAVSVKKVESNDAMTMVFVFSYFIPILARFADAHVELGLVLAVVLILVFWHTNSIVAHPPLRLFGFRFYKIETTPGLVYTLIARRDIRHPSDVRSVRRITGWMLMEI